MDGDVNKIPINTPYTSDAHEERRPRKDNEYVTSSDEADESENTDDQPTKIKFWDRIDSEGLLEEFEENNRLNGQPGIREYSHQPLDEGDHVIDKDELERSSRSQDSSGSDTISSDTIQNETMSEDPSQLNQPDNGFEGEKPEKNESENSEERLQLTRGGIKQFLKDNLSENPS
jgi:hypothetical protein